MTIEISTPESKLFVDARFPDTKVARQPSKAKKKAALNTNTISNEQIEKKFDGWIDQIKQQELEKQKRFKNFFKEYPTI